MGQVTLLGFQSRLSLLLGDRDLSKGQMQGWINDGLQDLTGAFDFIELHQVSTAIMSKDADSITLPSDLAWVRSVKDDTNERPLIKISEEQFWSILDHTEDGEPEYWTRQGNVLRVHPLLDDEVTIRIFYNRTHPLLEANGSKTLLMPTFDVAIKMFAAHHALMDLGEETRAAEWLARGMTYVRSRLMPQEFEDTQPMLGVRVPRTLAELRRING